MQVMLKEMVKNVVINFISNLNLQSGVNCKRKMLEEHNKVMTLDQRLEQSFISTLAR